MEKFIFNNFKTKALKKILIIFTLLYSFACFSQDEFFDRGYKSKTSPKNGFRKMNWGDSVDQLKLKYPDVEFTKERNGNEITLAHEEYIFGIQTLVIYIFIDNSLLMGAYVFSYESGYRRSIEWLKEYNEISEVLKEKYEMKIQNKWTDDSYKGDPNSLSHALSMGHVDLVEVIKDDGNIIHTLKKVDGDLLHGLRYVSSDYQKYIEKEKEKF